MGGRRERAIFWGVVAVLVLGAAAAWRILLGPEPGTAPPLAAPAPPPERLSLLRVTGDVTVVRGGSRLAATPGIELRADDGIETAPGARVELEGGSYRVSLEEGGRFDVREVTAEISSFRLGAGLLSAQVEDDPARAVEIEGAPDAVARTTGGEMSVSRSGEVVAVGVRRGAAEFRAAGKTVALREGQQSTAVGGKDPSPPSPLPPSLLLKVSWPEERTTNQRRIVVTGRTVPGAVVVLGGEKVEVGEDGRFTQVILLREGRQALSARAYGVGGSATAEGPVVVLDTRAPDASFHTRDLWKKPEE